MSSRGSITDSGGTVYIAGTYDNSGQTLNGSGSPGELTLYGGTISGGTVTSAGLAFTNSGTLSGVTFEGPLNLTASGQSLAIANGTTVVSSSGAGAGAINDTGEESALYFDNTQTFSNATINLGNSVNDSYLDENDTTGAGDQILTLASSVTVDVVGNAYIEGGGYSGEGIVNQGAIDQTGNGSALYINNEGFFINQGTIDAEATGGSLTIYPTTFANRGKIQIANGETVTIEPRVTGKGTDTISGGSTLEFVGGVSSAKTLGDQNIEFSGGGTLHLLKPTSFYGEISDFAAGDAVELLGKWKFSRFSENAGGTLGTLTLANGEAKHAFEFAGDYTRSDFSITPGKTTTIGFA
jgi:hypothetical protein